MLNLRVNIATTHLAVGYIMYFLLIGNIWTIGTTRIIVQKKKITILCMQFNIGITRVLHTLYEKKGKIYQIKFYNSS